MNVLRVGARRTGLRKVLRRTVVAGAAVALLAACGSSDGGGDRNGDDDALFTETMHWTSPAAAGGGTGLMTELLVKLAKREGPYPKDVVVEYREGGGGTRGYGHVFEQKGDRYTIVSTNSSFIATPLQADTTWTSADFTPVALMGRDYPILVVPGDSGIDTLEDFVAAAKKKSPAIGGVGTVNLSFIIPTIFAEEAGFEFRHVPFDGFGALQSAMLSGSLQATTGEPTEVAGLLASGDLKGLATMSPNTLKAGTMEGVDYDIPTFKDAGYDMPDLFTPRGIALPPDADPEVTAWWIETAKRIAASPEWQSYLKDNLAEPGDLYGEDFGDFLATSVKTFTEILESAGVI